MLILPCVCRFLVQNVRRWELETSEAFNPGTTLDAAEALVAAAAAEANGSSSEPAAGVAVLDRWIAAAVRSLTAYVRAEMEAYRLYTVVPRLVSFIDQLTNIYVRYNRKRLKVGVRVWGSAAGPGSSRLTRANLRYMHAVDFVPCKQHAPRHPAGIGAYAPLL
jgi:hypothetical protein